ncbi:methyltransferase domain-containing protein [Leptospira sp. 'Mane']
MAYDFANILVDPLDKGSLVWLAKESFLYNPRRKIHYPLEDGLAKLLPSEALFGLGKENEDSFFEHSGATDSLSYRPIARYEGLAEWYDEIMRDPSNRGELARSAYELLKVLIGKGSGFALDIGCGTGLSAEIARESGYDPIGIDLSFDQLKVASKRLPVVLGDAAELPIAGESISLAYSTFTTTDWEDLERAAKEIYRVLAPGGRYVDIGVHPCFYGGYSETREDGVVLQKPGYKKTHYLSPDSLKGTVRSKVGAWHRPLADVLNLFIGAGFHLTQIEEGGAGELPSLLALSFIKK